VCGNDIDTKLTEAEVDAFVANNGFASSSSLAPVASSGRFSDLSEIPTAIADGDADTLGALTCVNGQVAKRQGTAWVCGNDIDTKLSEAEVDAFVANNGFAPSNEVLALQDFETHASNADAHHSATSAGIAITPASITLDGTATSLLSGRLDLGAGANDELTAAMVQTLTGGGNADALHTHAGAGGGACYTAWGVTSCATGFTASYTGTIVAPFPEAGGPPGAPICLGGTVDSRAASTRYLFAVIGTTTAASTGARGCAVCCK
jgi:hypothetical protein